MRGWDLEPYPQISVALLKLSYLFDAHCRCVDVFKRRWRWGAWDDHEKFQGRWILSVVWLRGEELRTQTERTIFEDESRSWTRRPCDRLNRPEGPRNSFSGFRKTGAAA